MKRLLPRRVILALLIMLYSSLTFAQNTAISGNVTDAKDNTPLPGVNVLIKGTTSGTITDNDGKYSINVSRSETLIFSMIGYISQDIIVGEQTVIDVALIEDVAEIEELVVVGYGVQKKDDLTGAVSVVNTENLEKLTTGNISKALQGQTSGVQVHGSGEPGASPKITIRGIGSFQNVAPLYVIDGVPVDHIMDFSTMDIESIQVLKDASACAIYGARGANGVIIITTNKGESAKMKVTYEGNFGWQNVVKRMDVTNRQQYQEMNNIARVNAGSYESPGNDSTSQFFIDSIDTDWQDAAFKTGYLTEHTLTFTGGNETTNYNVMLNYFSHTGTFAGPGPKYERYSFRVNSNSTKGKFKIGESLYYSNWDRVNLTTSQWGNTIIDLVLAIPTVSIYDDNNLGGYGGTLTDIHYQISPNIIATNNLFESKSYRNRFLGIVFAEYEFIEGLNYRINLSYDRADWRNTYFEPEYFIGDRYVRDIAIMDEYRGDDNTMLMEHTLTFDKTIGKLFFNVMGGYTVQKDVWNTLSGHAEGFTEPYYQVLSAGTSGQGTQSALNEHNIISYLGRLNLIYDDKYLLTANFRRDGSSRFSSYNRWANFPSIAVGWKIHNESFFNVDFISMLKLRAGYGRIGNEKIGEYQYESYINQNASYVFGGVVQNGAIQTRLADEKIVWEEKVTKNIGVDMAMLNNKIEFTAEYYHNEANNLLLQLPIPYTTGVFLEDESGAISSPYVNGASMFNKGFEFVVIYRDKVSDFSYEIAANVTTLKNEVTKLGKYGRPITTAQSNIDVGNSMGGLYGWDFIGIFQTEEQIDTSAFQNNYTSPGDCIFRDVDTNGVINDDDRVYLGDAFPKLSGGINITLEYKGFDLSIFAQGIYGNSVWNGVYERLNEYALGNYSIESYNNYWDAEDNPTNKYPRLVEGDPSLNNRMSKRWVQDGSYLRIQNIQLGYSLPQDIITRIPGISSFRVYISGQNLYTFTKYTGYDPDINNDGLIYRGVDYGSYPSPRTYLIGVKISL